MTKAEAKWLGEEIGCQHPEWRFRRLVFKAPNAYVVEVEHQRTGERRELDSWAEWDALATLGGAPDPEPTVQMVDAAKAADGFIEYRGDAEPLDAWIDSLAEYEVEIISDGLRGWGEYTRLVKLTSSDGGGEYHLFYLVTDEAMPYVTTA